uniref:(northern house mosquito) hypothetical protein n=1 Tax=Culex pipiens TaxID=7175 RepID=A0A8D8F660_CULPI
MKRWRLAATIHLLVLRTTMKTMTMTMMIMRTRTDWNRARSNTLATRWGPRQTGRDRRAAARNGRPRRVKSTVTCAARSSTGSEASRRIWNLYTRRKRFPAESVARRWAGGRLCSDT